MNPTSLSRRDALGLLGLAGAAPFVLGGAGAAAAASTPTPATPQLVPGDADEPPVYRFKIGEFSAAMISDGFGELPAPLQPTIAPQAKPAELLATLQEAYLPTNRIPIAFNVFLVDTGKERLLVDGGNGAAGAPKSGHLLRGLARLGLRPEDISLVFLSHGHGDHLNGLLTADEKPTFPQARHFVLRPEWDFWTNPNPDLTTSPLPAEAKQTMTAKIRHNLLALEKQFVRIADQTELTPGVKVHLTAGHTPGHGMLEVTSGSERLFHVADLTHHHVIMFQHPDWTFIYDVDPRQAVETRRRVFAQAAQERAAVVGSHLPFPGLGHIRALGSEFAWVPQPWTQPV